MITRHSPVKTQARPARSCEERTVTGGVKQPSHRKKSILQRMLPPLIAVMLVQAVLFSGTLLWGGTVQQLDQNSADIFLEQVSSRRDYLQNEMVQRWSNLSGRSEAVTNAALQYLAENDTDASELRVNSSLSTGLLEAVSEDLLYLLRRNGVTGAFIVLNDAAKSEAGLQRSGLYIRDQDPASDTEDRSDLMVLRAPSLLTQKLKIAMDTGWAPQLTFFGSGGNDDFYEKPMKAALENPELSAADLARWSGPFEIGSDGVDIVTYSLPLFDGQGKPFAVLGVELTTDYLRRLLPYGELMEEKKGSYLLACRRKGETKFTNVVASGPLAKRLLGSAAASVLENPKGAFYGLRQSGAKNDAVCACVQPLALYNTNTPFSEEEWVLVGLVAETSLYAFSHRVKTTVALAVILSLLLGILGICLVARRFAHPIARLAGKVRGSDPAQPVKLPAIRISEIDELSEAVESLSRRVADSASRLSQIIRLTDIPIAAFELSSAEDVVFCTPNLFEIFGEERRFTGPVSKKEFEHFISRLQEYGRVAEPGNSFVYTIAEKHRETRWVRMKVVQEPEHYLGVATDITREIMEKRKIEYERDYDLLTNLLNRRAFHTKLNNLFQRPEGLGVSAFLMLDLDNLKYVNDTYGHDYGDEYIRGAADVLRRFTPYRALVARMSGDEFYVFLYGYQTQDEVRAVIGRIQDELKSTVIPIPGGQPFRVRASGGVAWYPQDSRQAGLLITYADFAMYKVKSTVKGEFNEFDKESYNKDSYLLRSNEELNRLIEEELVEYHFQPIADVRTGEIFAYEALMRSQSQTLRTPTEVLTMARSQSKLGQIERLTWFKALAAFSEYRELPCGCKLFINSIPNQILSDADACKFEQVYAGFLDRIVLEITEEEKLDEDFTQRKKDYVKKWNSKLAMDDFGTGYNGDAVLLELCPDFVKIDMSVVRGIDSDPNRRQLFCNLVSYTRRRGIKVIAEGVETRGEMEAVVACGADYLQGYYLGKPAFQPQVKLEESVLQELLQAPKPDGSEKAEN